MNIPVSFELAKLLKEKGFPFSQKETYYNPVNGFTSYEETNPTIAEVVMWLYENHGIWIVIDTLGNKNDYPRFDYKTISLSDLDSDTKWLMKKLGVSYEELIANSYNTPTEAYEAAIKYILNNLI